MGPALVAALVLSSDATMISRAVYADGRLWLRTDHGDVFSIADGEKQKRDETAGLVLDLCTFRGHVLALTRQGKLKTTSAEGAWKTEATLDEPGEDATLACDDSSVRVLAAGRLLTWRDGKVSELKLSEKVGGLTVALLPQPDRLLAGINVGEWGGGLRSIDLKTGAVKTLEKKGSGLCDGPLNAKCDPVHAVVPAPWKPGCAVLAVGLLHMMASGSLLTLCGEEIEVLVSRPLAGAKPKGDRYERVAFFGLARAGDTLWAAGNDGLYEVTAKGAEQRPLPKFTDAGGVKVSFAIPGLVLVLTDVNQRASLSGAVPLLVAR